MGQMSTAASNEEDQATTSDTDTDVDTNLDEKTDELVCIDEDKDNDHPPEYYVRQEDEFDESDIDEDYAESSCTLLDYIEGRFAQQAGWIRSCLPKSPVQPRQVD